MPLLVWAALALQRSTPSRLQWAAIAVAALAYLPDAGGSIIVDAGTSTAALVDHLPADLSLVAITHGVVTAAQLARSTSIDLHVLGGHVRDATGAAVGSGTVEAYGQIGADVAFVGANGISPERGLTTADFAEAAVKRAVVTAARRTVVLAVRICTGLAAPSNTGPTAMLPPAAVLSRL